MKWKIILVVAIVSIGILAFYLYFQQEQAQNIVRNRFGITTPSTQAIPNGILTNQLNSRSYNMLSSTWTNVYVGTLIEFIINNEQSNTPYGAQITLRGKNNSSNTFLLTKNEMTIVKAERHNNEEIVPIPLTSIKGGDFVTIREKINMLEPWGENRLAFIIIIK